MAAQSMPMHNSHVCTGDRCGRYIYPHNEFTDNEATRNAFFKHSTGEQTQPTHRDPEMIWVLHFPDEASRSASNSRLLPDCYTITKRELVRAFMSRTSYAAHPYRISGTFRGHTVLLVSNVLPSDSSTTSAFQDHTDDDTDFSETTTRDGAPSDPCLIMTLLRTFIAMQAAPHASAIVHRALQLDRTTRAFMPHIDAHYYESVETPSRVAFRGTHNVLESSYLVLVIHQLFSCMLEMTTLHPHAGALGWILMAAAIHPYSFRPTAQMTQLCEQVAMELAACSYREGLFDSSIVASSTSTTNHAGTTYMHVQQTAFDVNGHEFGIQMTWDDIVTLGENPSAAGETSLAFAMLFRLDRCTGSQRQSTFLASAYRLWYKRFSVVHLPSHRQAQLKVQGNWNYESLFVSWENWIKMWLQNIGGQRFSHSVGAAAAAGSGGSLTASMRTSSFGGACGSGAYRSTNALAASHPMHAFTQRLLTIDDTQHSHQSRGAAGGLVGSSSSSLSAARGTMPAARSPFNATPGIFSMSTFATSVAVDVSSDNRVTTAASLHFQMERMIMQARALPLDASNWPITCLPLPDDDAFMLQLLSNRLLFDALCQHLSMPHMLTRLFGDYILSVLPSSASASSAHIGVSNAQFTSTMNAGTQVYKVIGTNKRVTKKQKTAIIGAPVAQGALGAAAISHMTGTQASQRSDAAHEIRKVRDLLASEHFRTQSIRQLLASIVRFAWNEPNQRVFLNNQMFHQTLPSVEPTLRLFRELLQPIVHDIFLVATNRMHDYLVDVAVQSALPENGHTADDHGILYREAHSTIDLQSPFRETMGRLKRHMTSEPRRDAPGRAFYDADTIDLSRNQDVWSRTPKYVDLFMDLVRQVQVAGQRQLQCVVPPESSEFQRFNRAIRKLRVDLHLPDIAHRDYTLTYIRKPWITKMRRYISNFGSSDAFAGAAGNGGSAGGEPVDLQTVDFEHWTWMASAIYKPRKAKGPPAPSKKKKKKKKNARRRSNDDDEDEDDEDDDDEDDDDAEEEERLARDEERMLQYEAMRSRIRMELAAYESERNQPLTSEERKYFTDAFEDTIDDTCADTSIDHLFVVRRFLHTNFIDEIAKIDAVKPWIQECTGSITLSQACLLGKYLTAARTKRRRVIRARSASFENDSQDSHSTGGGGGGGGANGDDNGDDVADDDEDDSPDNGAVPLFPRGVCLHTLFPHILPCSRLSAWSSTQMDVISAADIQPRACPHCHLTDANLATVHHHIPTFNVLRLCLGPSWPRHIYSAIFTALYERSQQTVMRQYVHTRLTQWSLTHVWTESEALQQQQQQQQQQQRHATVSASSGASASSSQTTPRDAFHVFDRAGLVSAAPAAVSTNTTNRAIPYFLYTSQNDGLAFVAHASGNMAAPLEHRFSSHMTTATGGSSAASNAAGVHTQTVFTALRTDASLCRDIMGLPDVRPTLSRATSVGYTRMQVVSVPTYVRSTWFPRLSHTMPSDALPQWHHKDAAHVSLAHMHQLNGHFYAHLQSSAVQALNLSVRPIVQSAAAVAAASMPVPAAATTATSGTMSTFSDRCIEQIVAMAWDRCVASHDRNVPFEMYYYVQRWFGCISDWVSHRMLGDASEHVLRMAPVLVDAVAFHDGQTIMTHSCLSPTDLAVLVHLTHTGWLHLQPHGIFTLSSQVTLHHAWHFQRLWVKRWQLDESAKMKHNSVPRALICPEDAFVRCWEALRTDATTPLKWVILVNGLGYLYERLRFASRSTNDQDVLPWMHRPPTAATAAAAAAAASPAASDERRPRGRPRVNSIVDAAGVGPVNDNAGAHAPAAAAAAAHVSATGATRDVPSWSRMLRLPIWAADDIERRLHEHSEFATSTTATTTTTTLVPSWFLFGVPQWSHGSHARLFENISLPEDMLRANIRLMAATLACSGLFRFGDACRMFVDEQSDTQRHNVGTAASITLMWCDNLPDQYLGNVLALLKRFMHSLHKESTRFTFIASKPASMSTSMSTTSTTQSRRQHATTLIRATERDEVPLLPSRLTQHDVFDDRPHHGCTSDDTTQRQHNNIIATYKHIHGNLHRAAHDEVAAIANVTRLPKRILFPDWNRMKTLLHTEASYAGGILPISGVQKRVQNVLRDLFGLQLLHKQYRRHMHNDTVNLKTAHFAHASGSTYAPHLPVGVASTSTATAGAGAGATPATSFFTPISAHTAPAPSSTSASLPSAFAGASQSMFGRSLAARDARVSAIEPTRGGGGGGGGGGFVSPGTLQSTTESASSSTSVRRPITSLPMLVLGDWHELITLAQTLIHTTPHYRKHLSYYFHADNYHCMYTPSTGAGSGGGTQSTKGASGPSPMNRTSSGAGLHTPMFRSNSSVGSSTSVPPTMSPVSLTTTGYPESAASPSSGNDTSLPMFQPPRVFSNLGFALPSQSPSPIGHIGRVGSSNGGSAAAAAAVATATTSAVGTAVPSNVGMLSWQGATAMSGSMHRPMSAQRSLSSASAVTPSPTPHGTPTSSSTAAHWTQFQPPDMGMQSVVSLTRAPPVDEMMSFDVIFASPAHLTAYNWQQLMQCSFSRIVVLDALAVAPLKIDIKRARAAVAVPKVKRQKRKRQDDIVGPAMSPSAAAAEGSLHGGGGYAAAATAAVTTSANGSGAAAGESDSKTATAPKHLMRHMECYYTIISKLNTLVRWRLVVTHPSLHNINNDSLWSMMQMQPFEDGAWRYQIERPFAWFPMLHAQTSGLVECLESNLHTATIRSVGNSHVNRVELALDYALGKVALKYPQLHDEVVRMKMRQQLSLLVWYDRPENDPLFAQLSHQITMIASGSNASDYSGAGAAAAAADTASYKHAQLTSIERARLVDMVNSHMDFTLLNSNNFRHAKNKQNVRMFSCAPPPRCVNGSSSASSTSSAGGMQQQQQRTGRVPVLHALPNEFREGSKVVLLRQALSPYLTNWEHHARHHAPASTESILLPEWDDEMRTFVRRFLRRCMQMKHDHAVMEWTEAQFFYMAVRQECAKRGIVEELELVTDHAATVSHRSGGAAASASAPATASTSTFRAFPRTTTAAAAAAAAGVSPHRNYHNNDDHDDHDALMLDDDFEEELVQLNAPNRSATYAASTQNQRAMDDDDDDDERDGVDNDDAAAAATHGSGDVDTMELPRIVQRLLYSMSQNPDEDGDIMASWERTAQLHKRTAPEPNFSYQKFTQLVEHGIVSVTDEWVAQFHSRMRVTGAASMIIALHACYPGWMNSDYYALSLFVIRVHTDQRNTIRRELGGRHSANVMKQIEAVYTHVKNLGGVNWTITSRGRILCRQLFDLQLPPHTTHHLSNMHTPHTDEKVLILCSDPAMARCVESQLANYLFDQWSTPQHGDTQTIPAFVVLDGHGVRGTSTFHFVKSLHVQAVSDANSGDGTVTYGGGWQNFPIAPAIPIPTTLLSWGCSTGNRDVIQRVVNRPQTRVMVVTHDDIPLLMQLHIPNLRTVFSIEPHATQHASVLSYLTKMSDFQDVFVYKL